MLNLQKLITGFILAIVIAFAQVGMVAAQDTTAAPLTGIVQTITLETDTAASVTTVVVTYKEDVTGTTQTVRLSVETAASLGLVTLDSTKTPPEVIVNDAALNQLVTIDPGTVIADATGETKEHPVGSKLGDFFGDLLGVDYDIIMAAHEDGTGFGVIAQALWMTKNLGGDANTFQMVIEAKKTGDYSNLILSDGSTPTATNWGQFKQEATDKGDKGNLGSVMSGKADKDQPQEDTLNETTNGNSNKPDDLTNNGNGKGKDKDKGGKGKGHDKP